MPCGLLFMAAQMSTEWQLTFPGASAPREQAEVAMTCMTSLQESHPLILSMLFITHQSY